MCLHAHSLKHIWSTYRYKYVRCFLMQKQQLFCIRATASSYLQAIFSHFYISMLKIDSVNVGFAASPS